MRHAFLMTMAVAILPASAYAISDEQGLAMACLLGKAEAMEPGHDNLANLAEMIVTSECLTERNAYLRATGATSTDGLAAYKQQMEPEIRAALIAFRGERTGLGFLSSN